MAKKTVVLVGEVAEVEADTTIIGLGEMVEGNPAGALQTLTMILVEEEEVLIMLEKISKMNAVIIQLVMAT